jgi:hypothetical protein
VSSFTAKSTGLTRSPIYELFCAPSTIDIVRETREQKVVFLNLPLKRYAELGRFAQVMVKTVWQRAIEHTPDQTKPVFLWADEAQFFVTSEDMLFQTTARSAGCATVFLTQNISSYYAMMNGRNGSAAADSLLGNLTTKIFHANGDPTMNEWAQRVFGQTIQTLTSSGTTISSDVSLSSSQQQSVLPNVQAVAFTRLRKGGEINGKLVDAFIFQGGRDWQGSSLSVKPKARNAIRTVFRQA